MKYKNMIIGGLVGALLAPIPLVIAANFTAPTFWEMFNTRAYLDFSVFCFLPGFIAGALGANVISRAKSKSPNVQSANTVEKVGAEQDEPQPPGLGKAILGGTLGIVILVTLLSIGLCIFLYIGFNSY